MPLWVNGWGRKKSGLAISETQDVIVQTITPFYSLAYNHKSKIQLFPESRNYVALLLTKQAVTFEQTKTVLQR